MTNRGWSRIATRRRCSRGALALATAVVLLHAGCKPRHDPASPTSTAAVTIQNKGSDTMVNLAQLWAEAYKDVAPEVDIEVSGGGSGVGIAALIRGTIDMANASRDMKPAEKEEAEKNTGKPAVEFVVGFDALVIYVNKANPLKEITNEQLAEIYGEHGRYTQWADLGLEMPKRGREIVRVSRQSSSGTYEFFREHVLGKQDFKLGSLDMNGSKEVVELVGAAPGAIGYSGLGYNDPETVRMLPVAPKAGEPAVMPSIETTMNRQYSLARPLLIYTLGEPQGELKKFIDWILSDAGQALVERSGYVPIPPQARTQPAPDAAGNPSSSALPRDQ